MMKDSSNQSLPSDAPAGKKFRLVVSSAEEAVRVIREKLGDDAKVLSVKQFGGEGLKRFISSPKLEVIAEIPSQDHKELVCVEENEVEKTDEVSEKDEPSTQSSSKSILNDGFSSSEKEDNTILLSRAGFDFNLLGEIKTWNNWNEIKDKPFADILKEITVGLSDRFRLIEEKQTTSGIALLGSPGVGKTTTLCKLLANEVFIEKTTPSVLKAENGMPNPDDSLRIFCEVIGVTLYREAENLPARSKNHPLFLDFPGLQMSDLDSLTDTCDILDDLDIQTRVLVINGAYDKEIIKNEIKMARHLHVTHLAVTHFDQITNSTKLWPIFLNSNLSPLCICSGQNVTGDYSINVLNQMISRTFPEELYSRGFTSYKKVLS